MGPPSEYRDPVKVRNRCNGAPVGVSWHRESQKSQQGGSRRSNVTPLKSEIAAMGPPSEYRDLAKVRKHCNGALVEVA